MNKYVKRVGCDAVYILFITGGIIAVWYIAAETVRSEIIFPSVRSTFVALGDAFNNPYFYSGLCGTLLRGAIGFAIATALFFLSFCLSCMYPIFGRIIDPIVSILRSLPAVAVTLILIIAVGGSGAPIVLGVLVIYPILYSAARARTATVSTEIKEITVLCGASRFTAFRVLWFPCLAGGLPDSMSSAFSYNIKAVIGAEILAQTADSLGMLMKLSQLNLHPSMLVAFVIAAVVVSLVCEIVLRAVLKAVLIKYID